MIIKDLINQGSKLLKKNNVISHMIDSEILMMKAIDKNREYVLLNLEKNLKKKELEKYNHLIFQRSLGKPIAYIIGKKDFWKYEFKVSQDVLIPRPDTELIIESVLSAMLPSLMRGFQMRRPADAPDASSRPTPPGTIEGDFIVHDTVDREDEDK